MVHYIRLLKKNLVFHSLAMERGVSPPDSRTVFDSSSPVVAPVVQAAGLKAVRPDQNDDDDLR